MELKQAADELGVSVRHLHRLIRLQAIPANKTTKMVTMTITKPVHIWDVDDGAIGTAKELMDDLSKADHYGDWICKWMEKLNLSVNSCNRKYRVAF